jgi:hypothetical protein
MKSLSLLLNHSFTVLIAELNDKTIHKEADREIIYDG